MSSMHTPVRVPKVITKAGQYRNIIDQCLRRTAAGTMSNKQCDTMVKACKAGLESFVAEQYLRQIGMDELLPDSQKPKQIDGDIEDAKFIDVANVTTTAEDLW